MQASRYNMVLGKRTKWITILTMVILVAFVCFFYATSGGSYMPAWLSILILSLLTLLALSIPRYITVSQTSIEVHCIMELTVISIKNIKNIRPLSNRSMKWCIPVPLLGIWGVWGYYGYYFDLRNFRLFKLFSKEWGNFIRIEDIYEEVIVVSCKDRDSVISEIRHKKWEL